MADRPHPREQAHPTPFTYVKVAIVLVALTGIEVGVFYIEALEDAFLPIFLILSVVKFRPWWSCFYMHLKFDSRLFSGLFVGGLVLAMAVVIVLLSLFQVLSSKANPPEGTVLAAAHGEDTSADEPAPIPVATESPADTTPAEVTPVDTPTTPPVVAGTDGQSIFMSAPENVQPQALWCATCHKIEGLEGTIGGIGPDLTHIATVAEIRNPPMTAEAYIFESISEPGAFIAPDFSPGLMTTLITEKLTDEQVNALVRFLLEQK